MNSFMEVKVVLTFFPALSAGSQEEHCGLCSGSHGPAPLLVPRGSGSGHLMQLIL